MANNQKSTGEDPVKTFYSLMYFKFDGLIKEFLDENPQCRIDEELGDDDFILNFNEYFNKYFKKFVENGSFAEDNGVPYLEFYTVKEEIFVFIKEDIKKAKDNFNKRPFERTKNLAKKMGYDCFKYKKDKNKKNKTCIGFCIPYSDFERKIQICASEKLDLRFNKYKKNMEELEKANDDLKKEITHKKKDIRNIKEKISFKENHITVLEDKIQDYKNQYEEVSEENSRLQKFLSRLTEESNRKIEEKNNKINELALKNKKQESKFKNFKKNDSVEAYNIWRMGRTIEKNYKSIYQNFESINHLIDILGKNLMNCEDGFEDNDLDLEFLDNQKALLIESLKSLERTYKQYNRILMLLEKNGIKIEEYDDIKDEDKLNVTTLDVIESSEVQEIMVETIKPSIYYDDERIFEGEIILTKPKE